MARFIGYLTAYKGDTDSGASRTSARMIEASARGWNIGGAVHVCAADSEEKKGEHRDRIRLDVDGGSTGAMMGHTVAWLTETDDKPTLAIHIPDRHTMTHDFSRVTLIDDETQTETVLYAGPAAEGK